MPTTFGAETLSGAHELDVDSFTDVFNPPAEYRVDDGHVERSFVKLLLALLAELDVHADVQLHPGVLVEPSGVPSSTSCRVILGG